MPTEPAAPTNPPASSRGVQPGLAARGPSIGLWELDVAVGADVDALRAGLGRAVDADLVVGLSSSLLGTLDPLLMPGGFRPLDRHQPDLLLWAVGSGPRVPVGAAATVDRLAPGLVVRSAVLGRAEGSAPDGPVPLIPAGPGAGGTYVLWGRTVPGGRSRSVRPRGGGPSLPLVLAGELPTADAPPSGRDRGEPGGIYLAPGAEDLRRLGGG